MRKPYPQSPMIEGLAPKTAEVYLLPHPSTRALPESLFFGRTEYLEQAGAILHLVFSQAGFPATQARFAALQRLPAESALFPIPSSRNGEEPVSMHPRSPLFQPKRLCARHVRLRAS